jgi:hypothetical protein
MIAPARIAVRDLRTGQVHELGRLYYGAWDKDPATEELSYPTGEDSWDWLPAGSWEWVAHPLMPET